MTYEYTVPPERANLVYRYHERLYRLALLVAGDADAAARLVERAYRQLPAGEADPEAALTRELLAGRPARRWRWSPDTAALDRATLDEPRADALLALLARLTPVARLIIGLFYITGSSPEEIAARLGTAAGDQPVAELLARFRVDAARAVGLVPAAAGDEVLQRLDRWMEGQLGDEETQILRRDLFENAELRALRDGLLAVRDLLPRAIPALFAAMPPLKLTERLLEAGQVRRRSRLPQPPARGARLALTAGVLLLAAAIVLVPSLLARRGATSARVAPSAAELIDGALHRFDRAALDTGVLHEQYRVSPTNGEPFLIDRWYDFASPNRVAVAVRADRENSRPSLQISSDGRALVQFRFGRRRGGWERAVDARTTEADAQAVLPLLRVQPQASALGQNQEDPVDVGPLYLAQAREAGATLLGQTTVLGRPAYLLSYRATELPTQAAAPSGSQPSRVVLTIDAQTNALLDVAVLAEGAAEATAQHPLQATLFEVLDSAPDERFYLASAPDVEQQSGVASIRFPWIDDAQFLSIDEAARRSPGQLLAPQQLPDDHMRGLAVAVDQGSSSPIALLYEGEFQTVLVLPNGATGGEAPHMGEERSAGDFRYRLVEDPISGNDGTAALVYHPDTPDDRLLMMLNNSLATAADRQATLAGLIASLTPVDAQTLPALRGNFHSPSEAAGGS